MKSRKVKTPVSEIKEELFTKQPPVEKHEPKTPHEEVPQKAVEEKKVIPDKEEEIHVSEIKVEEKSSFAGRIIVPAIIGAVVGIVTATTTIFYYNSWSQKTNKPEVSAPTVVITKAPVVGSSATDSGVLSKNDLTLYDIKVLNGSGKSGEAGRVEKILKEKGYSVLDIGNADKSTYKTTLIKAKKKVSKDYLEKLHTLLEGSFDMDTDQTLEDKEETDVVVIVGSGNKTTVSPTTKP